MSHEKSVNTSNADLLHQFGVRSDIKISLNKIDQPKPNPEVDQAASTSKDQKIFDGSVCSINADNSVRLKKHTKTHAKKFKKIKCSQCDYWAGNISNLKRHVFTRHTNATKRQSSAASSFSCKICSMTFPTRDRLYYHHRQTHKNTNANFICTLCLKVLNSKYHLMRHAKTCKLNPKQRDPEWVQKQKEFKCKLCEYSACTKGQVDIHTRSHTGERPYACSACSFTSAVLGNLNNHMKTHTQVKEFKCLELECNYEGRSKSNLIRHMERQHHPEKRMKKFKCELCPKSFYSRQDLYGHISIHTQERPFACHLCEYSCTSNGNLKKHVKIHTGEKLYMCQYCNCSQRFSSSSNSNRHEKICNNRAL